MNIQIVALLALPIAALAAGAAQARSVTPAADLLTGYVPHRVLLAAQPSAAGSEDVVYYGDVFRPLVIHLPADLPRDLPVQGSAQDGETGLPRLYKLLRDDDEPEMEHPRREAEWRDFESHHSHRHIHLGDGDGHGHGDDSGGVSPVPLPGSLPLLASLLGLLAAAAAWPRRAFG